MEVIGLGLF